MNRDRIATIVLRTLARQLEVEPSLLHPSHDLEAVWSLDVFDVVLISTLLEEELAIDLPTPALRNVTTVGELMSLVRTCARVSMASARARAPRGRTQHPTH